MRGQPRKLQSAVELACMATLIYTWSFALLMAAWGSAAAGVPDSRMVIS
jgi:hypothetical protein